MFSYYLRTIWFCCVMWSHNRFMRSYRAIVIAVSMFGLLNLGVSGKSVMLIWRRIVGKECRPGKLGMMSFHFTHLSKAKFYTGFPLNINPSNISFEGVCRIQLMDLQIRWRTIFVTQRKCLLEPERANCLVQRTVSCPIGVPGVDAHWWENKLL